MEKDIGKIPKNAETEILVRIDDFGGRMGLTIREYVTSERYTGFTKAGTRISAENFEKFRELINSVDPNDLKETPKEVTEEEIPAEKEDKADQAASGIDSEGLM